MLGDLLNRVWDLIGTFKPVRVVPPDELGIRVRLGRVQKALTPGCYYCIPFVDTIRTCLASEQSIDMPIQTLTMGSRSVSISGAIRFKVVDAERAIVMATDYRDLLTREALGQMASAVDEASGREEVEETVEEALNEVAARWGIAVLRFAVTDFAVGPVLRLIQN